MATPLPTPEIKPPLTAEQLEQDRQMKRTMTIVGIGAVLLLILLGVAIYFLLQPATPTDKIRDIFIIIVALESLVIGVALIILVMQLASLVNLLQNEVRPILKATNETVNNLRGTAECLGENVVEPLVKLNGYLSGWTRVVELIDLKKK